jgi:hypothetical protein
VTEFDAELYLRLAAERTLLDAPGDDGHAEDSPLEVAGHALVAVRAITAGAAQAVVDDYYLALAYRRGEHPHRHLRAPRSAPARGSPRPGLGALRAVPCWRLIEQPWGQLLLRYLVLRSGSTSLHVEMGAAAPPAGPASLSTRPGFASAVSRTRVARPGPVPGARVSGPGFPQQLSLTDDRGTTVSASLSGGGNDSEWDGEFEASPGLAAETAWIEVLGQRVELPAAPSSPAEAWVEPLDGQDRALAYLWARVAAMTEFHAAHDVESSIEVLVAVGSLAPGDPALAEVRDVAAQLSRRGGRARAAGHPGPLPEPWQSLLARRGRAGGPEGLVVASVTTPEFEGITVAVLAVQSAAEGFSADVETVPGLRHWRMFRMAVDEPALAWWAADDRGHHYLGRPGSWHSGPDHSGGQIEFWPALDPAAKVLDIMPTTMTARAVIRVPLEWGEEP